MKILQKLTAKLTREKLNKFLESYKTDKKTLDVGCASDKHARFFPNRVGLDIKPGPGVDVVGDAHDMPFKDNEFDQVVCLEVLEHLHTPEKAIKEMKRILKPGGRIILSTRFIFPLHDIPGDYFRYTKYGLKHLFREGWEIEKLVEEASTKETFLVLLQRVGYQSNLCCNKISKLLLFLFINILKVMPDLIKEEYGNIGRSKKEKNILTSGYYLAAKKL